MGMRTRLLALLALLPVLVLAAPAWATGVSDVVAALRSDPVYVDAKATVSVDADKVRSQVRASSRAIYVAVLPTAAGDANGGARGVTLAIAEKLPTPAVTIGLVGEDLVAVSSPGTGLEAGQAQALVDSVSGGATDRLVESVRKLQQVQVSGGGGNSSGGGDTGGSSHAGSIFLGLLALGAAGGGGFLYSRKRRRERDLQGLRADVESLYNRLGSDVSSLPGGDDAVAKQALSDAAERYNATGALLANADTPGEYAAARRTAVEGLIAARTAREKLGLDPGPEIPPPPVTGPQLAQEQRVRVGDQEFEGSPTYRPGYGHYYGGGYYNGQVVPGGWYATPFWETMLLTSVLTGGFGGGFGGGGYERGYEEGVDDARDAQQGGWGGGDFGGGGWGGGGGGDFGGGDFGGGGGGDGGGSW